MVAVWCPLVPRYFVANAPSIISLSACEYGTNALPLLYHCSYFLGMYNVWAIMSDWVGASNVAIKRFGRDVCGPTNAKFYAFAAAGLSLPPHRAGHSSSSVLPVPAFTPELFFESFGRAQAVVGVMNAILAGPITVFLAAIFVFVVVDWVLIFTNPAPTTAADVGSIATTIVFTAFLPGALVALSSVGDVYKRVTDLILAPNVFMKITEAQPASSSSSSRGGIKQMQAGSEHSGGVDGRIDATSLTSSLERTNLAFAVFTVGMTSQNVIYLIGSISVTLAISLAPQVGNG